MLVHFLPNMCLRVASEVTLLEIPPCQIPMCGVAYSCSYVLLLSTHSCMPLQQLPTVTKDACEHAQVLCTCSGQANGALNMSTLYPVCTRRLSPWSSPFRVGVVLQIRGWRVVRKLVLLLVLRTLPPTV